MQPQRTFPGRNFVGGFGFQPTFLGGFDSQPTFLGGFGSHQIFPVGFGTTFGPQQQNKRCGCGNIANPGKDFCQSCYVSRKQQNKRCGCGNIANPGKNLCQSCYIQQNKQPKSHCPFGTRYATPSSNSRSSRVCCRGCGTMVPVNTYCCGYYQMNYV